MIPMDVVDEVVAQQGGGAPVAERCTIWQGVLEWIEKGKNPNDIQKLTRHVPCQVSANPSNAESALKTDTWPQKLIMQLIPKQLIGKVGGDYLRNSKSVLFHPQSCEALVSLTEIMSSGFAGFVDFTRGPSPARACDIKVLILLYAAERRAYLGFIPLDQTAFITRLRKVIQDQKNAQALISPPQQPAVAQQGGSALVRDPAVVREPIFIWQGVLEWIENTKDPNDLEKLPRHIPCQVSASPNNTGPPLQPDTWPQKLIVQMLTKQLIGKVGGDFLTNSKSIIFHPQTCEALTSLTEVMNSGFIGCVHFVKEPPSDTCDLKVLLMLYSSERRAYLGFIPSDQDAFVVHLRKVIQDQKKKQDLIRQHEQMQTQYRYKMRKSK